MEIKGKFVKLLAEESGVSKSGKDWKKQSFVIEHESGQYPKHACFECWGDTTDLIQKLKYGQTVIVKFGIESREYNGKYYTGLKALTIDSGVVTADQSTREPAQSQPAPSVQQQYQAESGQGGGPALPLDSNGTTVQDDLPF